MFIGVYEQSIAVPGHALLLGDFSGHGKHVTDQLFVFGMDIIDGGDLFGRNDQDMNRRLGLDIAKRRHLLVLVYDVCRYVAVDNFRKERRHGGILLIGVCFGTGFGGGYVIP